MLTISELDLYRKGYLSIYVTATHLCNLRCGYCYDKKERSKSIDSEFAKHIVREVESTGLKKYFYDISGGEFMLIEQWGTILETFLKSGKDVVLNTNGTMINTDSIMKLKELDKKYRNRLFLSVSLDSSNPEINSKIRVGRDSVNVFSALELLRKNNIRFRVAITLSSLNKDDIIDTVRYIVSKYSKELIIGVLRPTFNQEKFGHLLVSKDDMVRIVNSVEKLKGDIGHFELYHCLDENRDTFCEAGRDRVCILPDGGVTACYTLQQDVDVVGNIYDESLKNILLKLAKLHRNRDNRCLLCEHQDCYYGTPAHYLGIP